MPHSEYLIGVILNIIVGSAITSRSNIQGDQIQMQHVDGAGGEQGIRHLLAAVDDDVLAANELLGLLHHLHIAHHDGAAVAVLLRVSQSLDGDLRAGTGGIAHGNTDNGFIHSSLLLASVRFSADPWPRSLPEPS